MQLEQIVELLEGVRANTAKCPAHNDHRSSLTFGMGDSGRVLLRCHAGCSFEEICKALDLPMSALMGEQEETTYVYRDEAGRPLYEKIRRFPKDFLFRRYVGDSTEAGLGDTRRVLYGLPELLSAPPDRWVFLCEGEKDTEAIRAAGGIATTYGGASDWKEEYAQVLRGRHVTVIQDKDDAGRKTASQILLDLRKANVSSVRLVEAREGKDASDHLNHGYGLDDFIEPSNFKPYDFKKTAKPVRWILDGYVAEGDLVLLAGKPKLGKSWWTMALAVAMANSYQNFIGVKVEEGKVLYFDEENPEDVSYDRIIRALNHREHKNLRYILNGGLRLDTHPELLKQEVAMWQPKLTIIDSLAAVQMKEENSRSEMGEILRGVLKPLAVETGSAILLIHHHDKQGYGPRGSGDIEAAVDSIINLRGTPGSGVFRMSMQSRRRKSAHEMLEVTVYDMPGAGTRLEARRFE